ncbi:MAG: UDP-3-O-(3-hydroxymyristoyl)glucosamine N-acyltransferase, partial [Thermodesulfobacteriota bacterium]
AGDLSFLANPQYKKYLETTRAGAIVLSPEYKELYPNCLLSENPYLDFARVVQLFAPAQYTFTGQSELAYIHPDAEVSRDATVYPFVHVGPKAVVASGCILHHGVYVGENARIGKNCKLFSHVSVLAGCSLGENVTLHPGVVVGSDGFGFAQSDEKLEKFPQIGKVIIEDNVEIGSNSTLDRAALGETRVGKGTKIDNQVQIGHNVKIGENSILVAQVGIAGSVVIGKNVILAGQVGVAGHLTIGDNCMIGGQSGINKDIKPNSVLTGTPPMEQNKYRRYATLKTKLPEIYKRLKSVETELEQMKTKPKSGGSSNEGE